MGSGEVTESVVGSRTRRLDLLVEVLVDDAMCTSANHGLSTSLEGRVVVFVQIILWSISIWRRSCDFLCGCLPSVVGFAETEFTLGQDVRLFLVVSSNVYMRIKARSWQFCTLLEHLSFGW